MKMSAPWNTYQKKVKALFDLDDEVAVGEVYEAADNPVDGREPADYAFDILVSDLEKFVALSQIMPGSVRFGNVTMDIFVHYMGSPEEEDQTAFFKAAFKGNPIVKDIRDVADPAGTEHCFIRFQPEVIQFFNDDISDFNGNWSGLAQTIAREVFEKVSPGINFCTADKRENEGS